MSELFDVLQDERAEHWLETGDTISAREFYLNHYESSPAPARSDAGGFPAEPAEHHAPSPLDDSSITGLGAVGAVTNRDRSE